MHLYIHVPFCARRCSYCDFAIAVRRRVPAEEYAAAVEREWAGWQEHPVWGEAPGLETVYFGGGTPSLLAAGSLERLLERFQRDHPLVTGAEITLETNPDDISQPRAAEWRRLGVNRISLGTQSFDPAVLAWMHRTHSAADIPRGMAVLREAGFENISLDLIFGLGPELARDWAADLDQAVALGPEHLSVYGLTVEPQTPLARWVERGSSRPADEDAYATEFLQADQRLTMASFAHYEVSNYARHGSRSAHNSAYWRRRPFIGLGPSAHSGFGSRRRWNLRNWAEYQQAIAAGKDVVAGEETLSDWQQQLEDLYLGLRTDRGVPDGRVPPEVARRWIGAGWARRERNRLVLTPSGWLRLDALVASAESHDLAPNLRP